MLEKVGEEPVCVIASDGAEDHIDLWIAERLQQVCGTILGVIAQIPHALEGMGHDPHIESIRCEALHADLELMVNAVLPEHAARETHDGDGSDHRSPNPTSARMT